MNSERPRSSPLSPSVTSRATSMPSIDVPLISPIAPIARNVPGPCDSTASDAKGAPRHLPWPTGIRPRSSRPSESLKMPAFRSEFLKVLSERGFVHQISDESGLDRLFATETVSAYIGFDATASSLHAGSLIQIMLLHWLQQTGHRPVALMGGGTTMIGDPSLKDEARKLLTVEDIERNLAGIKRNFTSYLDFGSGPRDALMINNADWLLPINYVDFLRDVGRHFSVNRTLAFDAVKLRLEREQSLSFLEFNYMILQAYDFVELNRRHGVRLQMGGSDQWGNILNGIEL